MTKTAKKNKSFNKEAQEQDNLQMVLPSSDECSFACTKAYSMIDGPGMPLERS